MEQLPMALNWFFEWCQYITAFAGNYGLIVFLSLVSAIIFLYLFKRLSDQERIRYHKRKIFGYILQLRLYQDRFGVLVSSVLSIVKHNIIYIRYTLTSLVVILIPLFIITTQINNRCGYDPLKPGRQFTITLEMDSAARKTVDFSKTQPVICKPSAGIHLETPPLRVASHDTIYWRARVDPTARNPREHIQFSTNGSVAVRQIAVSHNGQGFSPLLAKASLSTALLWNAEGFLGRQHPFTAIAIDYERATFTFLFWQVDALVLYFILTLLFALILKPLFRVTI